MKTQTITQKNALKFLSLFGLLMILNLVTNPLVAQSERTIKGIVSDEIGPLDSATIVLKGTNIAVDTDEKGAFTFPQKLKENDTLVVIQLGYTKKEVIIGPNTTFLEILMKDYDIVIVGALKIGNNDSGKDQETRN